MQVILLFIKNDFILNDSINFASARSVLSTLFVVGISYSIYFLYQKNALPGLVQQEELIGTHSLDEILDLEFPLIQRLKQHSIQLYNHSLFISELCGSAAKAVGANVQKAKAGGLYHEIGRIESKQYVEDGVTLAEAYHLPCIIMDIIKQHNLKYEKPNTPEAAIVMMTVSLITTKEYLEKTVADTSDKQGLETSIPIKNIVNDVFQMRLSKGSLDDSGLTLQQYNKLKDFYLHM